MVWELYGFLLLKYLFFPILFPYYGIHSLGVTVDNLSFEPHINLVCKKVSQKLHTLARVSKFILNRKLTVIMKTFIMLQFNYFPLVWMCHNKTLNNKINELHERALRLVYDDRQSTFEELLNIDKHCAKNSLRIWSHLLKKSLM